MSDSYLVHHGILGQKWGIRRFQNVDGSLTEAGKKKTKRDDIQSKKKLYKTLSIGLTAVSGILGASAALSISKQLDLPESYRDYTNAALLGLNGLNASMLGEIYKRKYNNLTDKEKPKEIKERNHGKLQSK